MLEPKMGLAGSDRDSFVPFSQAPVEFLKLRVAIGATNKDPSNEHYDDSFRRMYAARILKERGL